MPRAADGKPDLTGVWQGGSTQRGNWEEANGGTGVGGTGRNPTAPVALSSNDRPAGREGAPYQDWAAKKVLEAYNRRGHRRSDGASCLPGGVPRSVMLGLFPQQFVQTPKQIVILYEYMNTFRVIPIDAKHPDDLIPSLYGQLGRALGTATRSSSTPSASTTRPGSPAPARSTRTRCTSPSAIRASTRTGSTTR